MDFECSIFSEGVASGEIGDESSISIAADWDGLIARMASRIYDALIDWLGPFSEKYPVNPVINKLPDEFRIHGVNALFDKDRSGSIFLNLDMLPLSETLIPYKLPYCLGNLLHEMMHGNLADFIYRPPEGTSVKGWHGDSFYDEGYLDYMGEMVASDDEIWEDPVFGNFSDAVFAGYVASNNRRLLNALGLSPGQEWSTPDFHIKRWAGQEYARKIGGSLFSRFIAFKEEKYYYYPIGCGEQRNYEAQTY